MFTVDKIRELIFKDNGEYCVLYKYIKDELSGYPERLLPFKTEFLFFEKKYMLMMETIMNYDLKFKTIVDIGCQFGIQNMLFEGYDYIGVDRCDEGEYFFRKNRPNVRYITGSFPEAVDFSLKQELVISCMSLGYFESDTVKGSGEKLSPLQLKMIDKLKESKYLFISSTTAFNDELKKHFEYIEPLVYSSIHGNKSYDLFFMTNEPIEKREDPWAIDSFDLLFDVQAIHHTLDDFEEGDITERIQEHNRYNLELVKLSGIEDVRYEVDEDLVEKYAKKNVSEMPTIVLGANTNGKREIIDGCHRVVASRKQGLDAIMAYVPIEIHDSKIQVNFKK